MRREVTPVLRFLAKTCRAKRRLGPLPIFPVAATDLQRAQRKQVSVGLTQSRLDTECRNSLTNILFILFPPVRDDLVLRTA